MDHYSDCPRLLRDFLSYHETIKGQSQKTINEYHLDLRMFLRFMKLVKNDMPYSTDLESIPIKDIDLDFLRSITTANVYDFLSYLAHDRVKFADSPGSRDYGIGTAARARKLSSIKSFYKYLTVRMKLLENNPVQDLEFPKIRKSLPKYLTLEQSQNLLSSVSGENLRDYAILLIFLNCGIRRAELVGLNLTDVYDDRLRVVGKGNKERFVYMGKACQQALQNYLTVRKEMNANDPRALFISREKNRISVSAVHRLVKKHMLEAGLDASQYSAHKLRHTAATLMLSGGVDVKTVQEVLGHEHLNTTEIYTHIENTELKIAADANPLSRFHEKD